MAKKLLQTRGIEYDEFDVTQDKELFNEMLELTEGQRTVPQIFIKDQAIGGFTQLASLAHSGQLDELLVN